MIRLMFSLFISCLWVGSASAAVKVGAAPSPVTIGGEDGGLVKDGQAWQSSMLKDKVYMFMYVDPDESDTNEKLNERLKAEELPEDKFGSVVVINMAASWKPNGILSAVLKSKQEKYPNTIFVKDFKSRLVKEWGLADQAYNVLLFDKQGTLLLQKAGAFDDKEITEFISLVKKSL